MTEKTKWIVLVAGSFVLACAFGALIFFQQKVLTENREEVSRLHGEIDEGRALVKTTPDLEREVIVQRETDVVIKEVLSDEEEITNFVRTIQEFETNSGISITSLKKQNTDKRGKNKESFDRVAYTLTFDTDAFQFLDFLDQIESHSRFISVTAFKLTAAKRGVSGSRGAEPVHNVSLNLETYAYTPKKGSKEVTIDGYERKRELLLSDIAKRTDELRVPVYDYRGPRGRRDPWVDPRVPANNPDGEPVLTIEEQINIVEALAEQAETIEDLYEEVLEAENLIAEMKARAALEEKLTSLEEEVRRIDASSQLIFAPSIRRFENDVSAVVTEVRGLLEGNENVHGPSLVVLQEASEAIERHIAAEEYDLAMTTFHTIEPRLPMAEIDPNKVALVEELRTIAARAQTVIDFESIPMDIGGVAVMEGRRPVALINGDSIYAGEYMDLSGELYVNDIRTHEIEFVYQGVTLVRRMEDPGYDPTSPTQRSGRN